MSIVRNFAIPTWTIINVVLLLNSDNLLRGSLEYQLGHVMGFLIITGIGIVGILYIDKVVQKRKDSKKITPKS